MRFRQYFIILSGLIALVLTVAGSSQSAALSEPVSFGGPTDEVTLEDFDDILTPLDLGFDDFGGNMGAINDAYLPGHNLYCATPGTCALRLDWDFGPGGELFTGHFLSLFGLTDTLTTFDGTITETLSFPEHSLNLNDIDGTLIDPAGPRQFDEICLDLTYNAVENVQVKLELSDAIGGVRFTRKTIVGSPNPQTICWDFRTDFVPGQNLDLEQAKVFTLIIEQLNVGAGVNNPLTGTLDLDRIWFVMDQPETEPLDDQALLDLMEKRAFQYFLDWSSRKTESLDLPQDRSIFGDLLTVGGIGFGVPAHIIGAERGWATRADSAARVLNILRVLDDEDAFGSEPVGRIGYRGWFYHFLGVDGRRKLNFDFPATPQNEALTTVELSSIDTSLAIIGILAAQSYFDSMNDPIEIEIRTRAQSIYDRVEWDFMLESDLEQYYLGWKPLETFEGQSFAIPDGYGTGNFSGNPGSPDTLDYYTDEALILLILGIGSNTFPIPPEAYQAMILYGEDDGLIRTFPGALFTYQFYHAFVGPEDCNPFWYNNSHQAIQTVIEYATDNPAGFATYGPTAWGISANESPYDGHPDEYGANGAPPVSVNPVPKEDGSITYYAMMSAARYGNDLRQEAISALRAGWDRGHWHPRFGLPDAFHDDVSEISAPQNTLRQTGQWQNRALFAIDQGPMVLHLENAYSGLIWDLIDGNPNIQRAFDRITLPIPEHVISEAEDGTGQGTIKSRSNAWGDKTVWLHAGESRQMTFFSEDGDGVIITVRYSNDNAGPNELVSVSLDGNSVGSFTAEDTGNGGNGWNVFVWSDRLKDGTLSPGEHTLIVSVSGGDGFGIEIDALTTDYYKARQCYSYIPAALQQPG